jgi:glycosyltransferase involved in cell wall biosynthesis
MTLLARALVERGYRVAHVTFAPREPVTLSYPLTLVYRAPYRGGRRVVGSLLEAAAVWRALGRANAAVVVVRTASPLVAVAALFCELRRRRLIFSASNVSDFTMETMSGGRNRALYRLGVRRAAAVVVQSSDQRSRALAEFPSLRRVATIPSFAETPPAELVSGRPGDAFLWFGRSVPEKRPLQYVELARAVPEARFVMVPVPQGAGGGLLAELRTAGEEVPNLEILDPLPHAELATLVSRAVAVVNTSTLEGMPNAFLEAWASGVPVLTLEFDPDGIVDRHGLGISAAGSWDRFAEGARELWRSRSDRQEVGRRVRSYIEDVHSPDAVAARWSGLIDEVRHGVAAGARPEASIATR